MTEIADDAPIPTPHARAYIEELYYADAFIRQPVMRALDPTRVPNAGDVNALDDVPRSTWFTPREMSLAAYKVDGPPEPPLVVVDATPTQERTLVVVDRRGLRYELRRDPADRPEMTTSAEAITSRLAWLFGWSTPEVWIAGLSPDDFATRGSKLARAFLSEGPPAASGAYRVSATREPAGIDLGPTLPYPPRTDDKNDRIPHAERRSMRALKAFGAWVELASAGPKKTRESYVGPRNAGHIAHWLVGLNEALGTARVVRPKTDGAPPDDTGPDPLTNLVTLGLAKDKPPPTTKTRFLCLGPLDEGVDLASYRASPPYDPIERALPADLYWAGKRIARIDRPAIVLAVAGGAITDDAARLALIETLDRRRIAVVEQAFAETTPIEVQGTAGGEVFLRDEAIEFAHGAVDATAYAVRLMDADGTTLGTGNVAATSARFTVELPKDRVKEGVYTIVHVVAVRGGNALPRACDVHVIGDEKGGVRVVGIRH